jgi:transposase
MEGTPMQKLNDLNRSPTPLKLDGTLIAMIEMSLSSWLVAGIAPGVERQPLKKLEADESTLLKLLNRWREEAKKAGHRIDASRSLSRPAVTASGWRVG